MDNDIRNMNNNGNKQLVPSQSRATSSGRISPFEGTNLPQQRISQVSTPRPEFPSLPELPPIPTFDFSSYDRWVKEWEASVRKWEMDVERYQVESKKWYDENYDTTNYIDEDGFSVYESVSKDGKSRIVMKMKFDHNNDYSRTTIWMEGKKVFDNERGRTVISTSTDNFSESRTVVTPRSTSTTYTTSRRRRSYRRRQNSGCCGCLIITLIMIAIIFLAIIGLKSLF